MIRKLIAYFTAVLLSCLSISPVQAEPDYALEAVEIEQGVWVVEGSTANFSRENGGNIVNTAFIETGEGVVVIDTGPSRRYGEALRRLIEKTTREPITHVLLTHHHPDHVFGNQAFDFDSLYMLEASQELLRRDGEAFADNMYRLVGDWMRGTEIVIPEKLLQPGEWKVGERRLELLELSGHTGADLAIFDETSGVLFAADLVFHDRALSTPQSPGLEVWLADLERLEALPYRWLVPGHGASGMGDAALQQTRDYLLWLDGALTRAASQGLSMTEAAAMEIPPRFDTLEGRRYELTRTVTHLYPAYEKAVLALLE
ncbi:quinoprotein relay system zinc metallohydrolase 1 [Halomonas sp. LR3S48]|uniref:quinoprotein relay system zinc metallohydrolase 1 n=1 Tax=Halomonas sp. LR3S48 TaxID=2982694 RepID=UPI0021E3ED8F|nr:quinoprotein relay system zinc metallohydrolase 1 [Halomonas sp. LR3S48]UYG02786.1 quinoprotein relay system zinc metallohydrolase 1 [Halomonas sp. LR3S48]